MATLDLHCLPYTRYLPSTINRIERTNLSLSTSSKISSLALDICIALFLWNKQTITLGAGHSVSLQNLLNKLSAKGKTSPRVQAERYLSVAKYVFTMEEEEPQSREIFLMLWKYFFLKWSEPTIQSLSFYRGSHVKYFKYFPVRRLCLTKVQWEDIHFQDEKFPSLLTYGENKLKIPNMKFLELDCNRKADCHQLIDIWCLESWNQTFELQSLSWQASSTIPTRVRLRAGQTGAAHSIPSQPEGKVRELT